MPWLPEYSKRRKITIDSNKVDSDLTDFPVMVALASGTGILNQDVSDIFDELTVTSSGVVDSYTKLLLHMDGDASASQHVVDTIGDPALYTSTTPSGMLGSMYFDGTGDYIDVPVNNDWIFGTGDFTIDYWVYPEKHGVYYVGWYDGSVWFSYSSLSVIGYIPSTGKQNFRVGGPDDELVSTTTMPLSAWTHVAISRSDTTFRLFINGTIEDSFTSSASVNNPNCALMLGKFDIASFVPTEFLQGYISEMRISKGIARWTSNFTPPSAPYTTDSYTKLLLHFEGDKSAGQHVVTFNGNPQMYSSIGKFDGSYRFDGTGDYLTIPDSSDWDFGSEDFTVDWWEYRLSAGTSETAIVRGVAAGYHSFYFNHLDGGTVGTVYMTSNNSSWDIASAELLGPATLNEWVHYAVVRDGNNFYNFRNGIRMANWSSSLALYNETSDLYIGNVASNFYHGYMSEVRISKGVVRWAENFDPPARAYPHHTEIYSYHPKKLAITGNDGVSQQYVEIEHWNPYKKEAVLWTKTATIVSGTDTDMYLYYGMDTDDNYRYVGDTGELTAQKVWDDDFMGVWHMAQDPSIVGDCVLDSTGNINKGTPQGSMTWNDLIDGQIAKALDFDGSDDLIGLGTDSSLNITNSITIESIVNRKDNADSVILAKWLWSTGDYRNYFLGVTSNKIHFLLSATGTTDDLSLSSTNNVDLNYNYLAATSNNSFAKVFLNGTENGVTSYSSGINSRVDTPIAIGIQNYDSTPHTHYGGILDEIRISDVARSEEWLKATYYSNWDDLLTFDSEELGPAVYFFAGYTKQYDTPVIRTVRTYRTDTGELMDETVSAGAGYYYMTTTHTGTHYLVCIDDPAVPDFNHLIIKDAIPLPIT